MIKTNHHIILFIIVLSIIFFGSFLMYSASSSFAYYKFNKSDTYFLFKHFLWVIIGMVGLFSLSFTNHYVFKKYYKIILFFSWFLMLIPILLNLGHSSIDRWLKIGNFTFTSMCKF